MAKKRRYTAKIMRACAAGLREHVRANNAIPAGDMQFKACGWVMEKEDMIELAEMLEAGAAAKTPKPTTQRELRRRAWADYEAHEDLERSVRMQERIKR